MLKFPPRRLAQPHALVLALLFWVALVGHPGACFAEPAPTAAPPQTTETPADPPPLITLEQALATALVGNRPLQNSRLDVVKASKNATAFKSNLYPILQAQLQAGMLLTPINVTFQQGAFGTFASTGPIPAKDTNITTPTKLTTYFVIALRQPISQLPRIQLGVKAKEIEAALAAEDVRQQREALVTDVKKAYYAILQTEAAMLAAYDNVKFYREMQRTVEDKYKEKTVLKTDLLDVRKRLADALFDYGQQRDSLATNKSQLNLLLGRDIHTDFRVTEVGESRITGMTLPDLEALAVTQRPQVHQAVLKVRQAELDRRITAAQYAPDINLSLNYVKPYNGGLLPDQIVTIGAELTWQPITWGKINNETQAKEQVVLQARNNVKQVSDQVLVEVGSQYRTVHTDQERVVAARMALDAALESLRVAKVRYGQKTVLLQDVYEAQSRVASAMRNYLEAVLALNIAQAELEQAIGED